MFYVSFNSELRSFHESHVICYYTVTRPFRNIYQDLKFEQPIILYNCLKVTPTWSCVADGLTWQRKSLGASGRVQTVYQDGIIQQPFMSTQRYIQVNTMTPDGFLESQLTITNLQRTDIAEYSCVWGNDGIHGEFVLDVIGRYCKMGINLRNYCIN